jgi:hypothetical protein
MQVDQLSQLVWAFTQFQAPLPEQWGVVSGGCHMLTRSHLGAHQEIQVHCVVFAGTVDTPTGRGAPPKPTQALLLHHQHTMHAPLLYLSVCSPPRIVKPCCCHDPPCIPKTPPCAILCGLLQPLHLFLPPLLPPRCHRPQAFNSKLRSQRRFIRPAQLGTLLYSLAYLRMPPPPDALEGFLEDLQIQFLDATGEGGGGREGKGRDRWYRGVGSMEGGGGQRQGGQGAFCCGGCHG